jgi:hypothetical protein
VNTEITDMTVNNGGSGSRRVPSRPTDTRGRWLLVGLPVSVIVCRSLFADWVFMSLLAFSIFLGFKWMTWRQADRSIATRSRSLLYLLAWPGMDAREFLTGSAATHIRITEWSLAAGKIVLGAALLAVASSGGVALPLLAGWMGIAGALLLVHFGVFHLLSLIYRDRGIAATPLMSSPLLAVSVSDFWANRWNRGFNRLAHDLFFRPLARRIGAAQAGFSAFVVSGLIHDLVISLPARGGYGWPTVYFVLQGTAVLFEKSSVGLAIGLRRGLTGRLFMLVVTTLPAPLLFHTAFVHNIVLPMLQVIGRLWGKP